MIRYCETCRKQHGLKQTTYQDSAGRCDFCNRAGIHNYVGDPSLLPRSHAVHEMLERKKARG